MDLLDFFNDTKQRLITKCTKCGNCISSCRVMEYTGISESPKKIQQSIVGYLKGENALSSAAERKVKSCMRCYGCLDVKCPIGTNSMFVNGIVNREMEQTKDMPWNMEIYPVHLHLSRQGTSKNEFERIRTRVKREGAEYLFFPGCNIYKQPDKLLNALTIMDEIGNDYSFAPGMEFCCGLSSRGDMGDAEWIQNTAQKLMDFIRESNAKKVVFWCATCVCSMNNYIKKFYEPPFEYMTFAQYVLENIEKLKFPNAKPHKVTYHEPCKAAYTGIDMESVQKILKTIPGTELVEMEHHGKDTMCCGCDAVTNEYEVGDKITERRLREAVATGADTMIDACHNCHWIFMPARKKYEDKGLYIDIVNYSTYITDAMGKSRKDTLE